MIGKVVCLLVVLAIAAHASEITTEHEVDHLVASDMGPGAVLAEVSSSVDTHVDADADLDMDLDLDMERESRRRRQRGAKRKNKRSGLRDLSSSYETFAIDDMDEDKDGSRITDYEEERREAKRRRRDAARRRREKRRKERRARRKAAKAEKRRKRAAKKAARKLARAIRKNNKLGAIAKQGMAKNPNGTAAALAAAIFPTMNGTNSTNSTNGTNLTLTIDPKILARQLKQAEMTKKDLALYKKYKKAEKSVKKNKIKERFYKAKSQSYEQWKKAKKEAFKRKLRMGRTDWAVRQGVAAIKSLQSELEREDVRQDKLFWDQYYGRNRIQGKGDKKAKKVDAKRAALPSKDEKKEDLALPLYKAAHIASFKQAAGKSKKYKKLDTALKEDGDKYIEFALNYA